MAPIHLITYVFVLSIATAAARFVLDKSIQHEWHETTSHKKQIQTANVSQCQIDLKLMFQQNNLNNASRETALALDAFGKPGSGILVGDYIWLGTYQECQDLTEFHYCLVDLQVNVTSVIPATLKDIPLVVPIRWGTCFPQSCNEKDIFDSIPQVLLDESIVDIPFPDEMISVTSVQCSNPVNKWSDGMFVFTFLLCCVLLCLMLAGYGFDLYLNNQVASTNPVISNGLKSNEETPLLSGNQDCNLKRPKDNTWKVTEHSLPCRFLLCFAVNQNLTKLLDTQQSDRSILCLNGIRVLSMFWVILGHTFSMVLQTSLIDNVVGFAPTLKQFGFQAIINATLAVDTFFLLSGLLVTLGCINRMEKNNGRLPWFWFYFHRYWRLTPALLFVILITIITPYFTNGPAWVETMASQCREYWWVDVLYIQNFYPGFSQMCVGHTWYLANDMQFYVISPVFIILLYKCRKLGLTCLGVSCLASFAVTIGLVVQNDFNFTDLVNNIGGRAGGNDNLGGAGYQDIVYQKPYCRISVYLLGIVIGFIIQRNTHHRIRIPKVMALVGWLFATILALSAVYVLYPAGSQGRSLSPVANALWAGLSSFVWSLGVSWVIVACYFGYGGPINNLLSWRGWVPISRLTYTAYLIHITFIYTYYMPSEVPWHISIQEFSINFIGFLGITYAAALLFSLAVEYPFANMEKLFLPSKFGENSGPKTTEKANTLVEETTTKLI